MKPEEFNAVAGADETSLVVCAADRMAANCKQIRRNEQQNNNEDKNWTRVLAESLSNEKEIVLLTSKWNLCDKMWKKLLRLACTLRYLRKTRNVGERESSEHSIAWTCEEERVQCTVQEVLPYRGHHCSQAISGTAARLALVYAEYIATYIQGLYNTVQVLGGCHCVQPDSSDQKYTSPVRKEIILCQVEILDIEDFLNHWSRV